MRAFSRKCGKMRAFSKKDLTQQGNFHFNIQLFPLFRYHAAGRTLTFKMRESDWKRVKVAIIYHLQIPEGTKVRDPKISTVPLITVLISIQQSPYSPFQTSKKCSWDTCIEHLDDFKGQLSRLLDITLCHTATLLCVPCKQFYLKITPKVTLRFYTNHENSETDNRINPGSNLWNLRNIGMSLISNNLIDTTQYILHVVHFVWCLEICFVLSESKDKPWLNSECTIVDSIGTLLIFPQF